MDFFEWVTRTVDNFHRHGLTTQTVSIAVITLYNITLVRKLVRRRIPKRWRHEDRLERVERKIDAVARHLGVDTEWVADYLNGKNAQLKTNGQPKKSLSPLAAYVHVIIARFFTRSEETYHSLQRRMKMKSKLLSRKFLMAVISAILVIANDGLNLGLDSNTIIAFGSIVVGYIAVQGAVDRSKKEPEIKYSDSGPAE